MAGAESELRAWRVANSTLTRDLSGGIETIGTHPSHILGAMTRDRAIGLIRSSAVAEYADALIHHLRPSVRIIVRDEPVERNHESLSHFGGLPFLPEDAKWPVWDKREFITRNLAWKEDWFEKESRLLHERPGQGQKWFEWRDKHLAGIREDIGKMREELSLGLVPLAFLGQFSLTEMSKIVRLPGWPIEGTLAFFYDASQPWGYDPRDSGHCRVLFVPEGESLVPKPYPDALPVEARSEGLSLGLECEWTLPSILTFEEGAEKISGAPGYDVLLDKLIARGEEFVNSVHRCGGQPQEIQNEMTIECQLVTNGLYCGDTSGYEDPRRAQLEKGAADWRLLAQFDSDDRLRWSWGGLGNAPGRVYFWARQQDIESADFANSWAILQC
jgi:uncharacterized protein YwqG